MLPAFFPLEGSSFISLPKPRCRSSNVNEQWNFTASAGLRAAGKIARGFNQVEERTAPTRKGSPSCLLCAEPGAHCRRASEGYLLEGLSRPGTVLLVSLPLTEHTRPYVARTQKGAGIPLLPEVWSGDPWLSIIHKLVRNTDPRPAPASPGRKMSFDKISG